MDIMEMQRNIKHNNEDLVDFVSDLNNWTSEIEQKDKNKELRDPNKNVSIFKLSWRIKHIVFQNSSFIFIKRLLIFELRFQI